MKIRYSSWLKNRLGVEEESVSPPADVNTPERLIDWLCAQNKKYADVFSHRDIISVSVNDTLVENPGGHPLKSEDKISFFSPMAGG